MTNIKSYEKEYTLRDQTKDALTKIVGHQIYDHDMIMNLYAVCAELFSYPEKFTDHQDVLRKAYRTLCETGAI